MQEILEVITAGETGALADTADPESYRGVVVRKDQVGMFEGLASRDKDRAGVCTWTRSRPPSWARAGRSSR